MSEIPQFKTVFAELKKILKSQEANLLIGEDSNEDYVLNTPFSPKYNKELFFGSVRVKKNYVSFQLMPVYMYPELLQGISDGLKKRMQGKSCFNFKTVDPVLFRELAELTEASAARIKLEKLFTSRSQP